jgi:YbbR domain-containing protein
MTDTPPRAAIPSSWRPGIVAAFRDHVLLKAAAVFLALVLWLVVNVKEPQIELVHVRFDPTLDSTLSLRDPPPELQALVAGSAKELIKLSSSPPVVRRQVAADAPDTLVVDLSPSDVILPPGIDAVVRDIQPRSIALRFESTISRRVPVQSGIELVADTGAHSSTIRFDPESVQVSGPRHLVAQVAGVRTVRMAIAAMDSLPHSVDLDTTALGVRVRPAQVKALVVPIRKR